MVVDQSHTYRHSCIRLFLFSNQPSALFKLSNIDRRPTSSSRLAASVGAIALGNSNTFPDLYERTIRMESRKLAGKMEILMPLIL